jgi:hypothetical protein
LAHGRPVVVNANPHVLFSATAPAPGGAPRSIVADRVVMFRMSASRTSFFIQGNTISGQGDDLLVVGL